MTEKKQEPPKRCFICERYVTWWRPPYVVLAPGKWAHFICYTNARTKLVQE